MKRSVIAASFLTIFCLSACSNKALTQSSAPAVMQALIDSQRSGTVSTLTEALTSQIGVEMPTKWSASDVLRLIGQGYLEEKTRPVSYPNFSGQYNGVHYEVNMFGNYVSTPSVDTIDLRMSLETKPPHVSGVFNTCFETNCQSGGLSGVVQRNAPSILTLTSSERESASLLSDRPSLGGRLVISLERGQTDAIAVTYDKSSIGGRATQFRAVHVGPSPPDIQQDAYVYSWTTKVPSGSFESNMLNLGHLVVDSCKDLLLVSETTATASCQTHIKLAAFAASVFGERPTEQPLRAFFGKQPDGSWVGTRFGYSAPPYSVTRADAEANTRRESDEAQRLAKDRDDAARRAAEEETALAAKAARERDEANRHREAMVASAAEAQTERRRVEEQLQTELAERTKQEAEARLRTWIAADASFNGTYRRGRTSVRLHLDSVDNATRSLSGQIQYNMATVGSLPTTYRFQGRWLGGTISATGTETVRYPNGREEVRDCTLTLTAQVSGRLEGTLCRDTVSFPRGF